MIIGGAMMQRYVYEGIGSGWPSLRVIGCCCFHRCWVCWDHHLYVWADHALCPFSRSRMSFAKRVIVFMCMYVCSVGDCFKGQTALTENA